MSSVIREFYEKIFSASLLINGGYYLFSTLSALLLIDLTGEEVPSMVDLTEKLKSVPNLKKKFTISLSLALVVVGLIFYGDVSRVGPTLFWFNWYLLPLILFLTICDDILRFV